MIFSRLFNKITKIYDDTKVKNSKFKKYTRNVLIEKTKNRMEQWDNKDLLKREIVIINGKEYFGIYSCLDKLNNSINKICDNSEHFISVIHGDLAFSNILLSPRTQIFRFIDPRGNYGIDSIYGDSRYDIAKLRHCYHGRYDEIINDMFNIDESNENINYSFYKNINYALFDKIISKKYNINDIEIIEGLLFISMIPLHKDYPERQKIFFVRGIECLNNQIRRRCL